MTLLTIARSLLGRPSGLTDRGRRRESALMGGGLVLALFLAGCVGIPSHVEPVGDFSVAKYLGRWHEIARLDHSFERGLTQVTAEYSLRHDGGVRVLNRGYSAKKGRWKEAEGKAYFVRRPDEGYLKVSFFGPFYGSYIVFELDHQAYQYALVCGPNKSYLWILARTPALDPAVKTDLVAKAKALGFDTDRLVFVESADQAGSRSATVTP
jgi:apolipoprotein D and lipocalin family protein